VCWRLVSWWFTWFTWTEGEAQPGVAIADWTLVIGHWSFTFIHIHAPPAASASQPLVWRAAGVGIFFAGIALLWRCTGVRTVCVALGAVRCALTTLCAVMCCDVQCAVCSGALCFVSCGSVAVVARRLNAWRRFGRVDGTGDGE
jgi:hypothetical protein